MGHQTGLDWEMGSPTWRRRRRRKRDWYIKFPRYSKLYIHASVDFAFTSNNILHTLHTSGAFVQYDLHRSLIKPLDAVPRNALAWSAAGEMAFVTGLKDETEVPFDDDGYCCPDCHN